MQVSNDFDMRPVNLLMALAATDSLSFYTYLSTPLHTKCLESSGMAISLLYLFAAVKLDDTAVRLQLTSQ